MALKHGSEHFTRWTHVENGQVLNRRLHRIEIQARDGRMYVLQGASLPDFIQTCAGHGYKGVHIAQILLDPNAISEEKIPSTAHVSWPAGRDVLSAGLGCLVFIAGRFFLNLLASV